MTNNTRPSPRPEPNEARPPTNGAGAEPDAGPEPDTVLSYGLDGFTPRRADRAGGGNDPQDSVDLEELAEAVWRLLLREAYIERERLGPR